ncbi:MAG: hypothetical protein H7A45_15560 [Verrucomicrobiales bacterium]|nr:hypothetical protein [Verrucomicrobiales bacterium]MCP5528700.1 hypothetical protein [Verrucomicrobiales bacterium]
MKCYRHLSLLATALVIGLVATGCGGVSASPSISPASFLLPGLVRDTPKGDPVEPVPVPEPAPELASAR